MTEVERSHRAAAPRPDANPEGSGLPAFLITVDTEGDNLWAKPRDIRTDNAGYLPRFQALCESYSLKPTYLTNFEMATSPVFVELARDAIARGAAEVGMHLHAWNSPPLTPLTDDDFTHQPYLIEYPRAVMRQKIEFMTKLLEDTFQRKMRSHRAGRWAFDSTYAKLLSEHDYDVDCSVTPGVSWTSSLGDPRREGGVDYTDFPGEAYFLDLDAIHQPGASTLLELPMTILDPRPRWLRHSVDSGSRWSPLRWLKGRMSRKVSWLRPRASTLSSLTSVLERTDAAGKRYAELMLHSSEVMPGGNPHFETPEAVEELYAGLEQLFRSTRQRFRGLTLSEYYDELTRTRPVAGHRVGEPNRQ